MTSFGLEISPNISLNIMLAFVEMLRNALPEFNQKFLSHSFVEWYANTGVKAISHV
jgi:hypothetical protein